MPEWFDSWLVDARTQNLIGLAGVIATVLLGAAAIWAPVRRLVEETFLLTSALLVNLVLLGAAALLCVAAVALLLLPAPFLALKLSVSAALLLWALRRPGGAPRSAEARMVALIAALSWAVLAVGLSRPAPSAMHRPAAPAAVPTPPLVVPTPPPPAPTLGGTLQGADGAALPTVTPGP
jgi:hypothetical protein